MKALVATIVDNINFGTYLQAYALSYILKAKGLEVDVLNYKRPYLTGKVYAKNYLKDKNKNILNRIAYCFGYTLLNDFMINNVKKFLTERVNITKEYQDHQAVVNDVSGKYDLYVTGSDQVWNCDYNSGIDEVFFWNGIKGEKVSYAASLGLEEIPENMRPTINKMLSDYSHISVREKSAVSVLEEIGINDVVNVLDPTFLLDKQDWLKVVGDVDFKKTEPYLLIYSVEVDKNAEVIQLAKKIAKERGLAVYMVCPTLKFKSKLGVDRVFSLAKVETFITLMSEADYVVVSSFHGTAFAINFNRQFVTVAPNKFNARVNSLLNLVGLSERYVETGSIIPDDIDFNEVNEIIYRERVASLKYIDIIIKK